MEEISNVILKERARQDTIIREHTAFMGDCPEEPKLFQYKNTVSNNHKQSLINMKEYIQERCDALTATLDVFPFVEFKNEDLWNIKNWRLLKEKNQMRFDITELTKMIGRYE